MLFGFFCEKTFGVKAVGLIKIDMSLELTLNMKTTFILPGFIGRIN